MLEVKNLAKQFEGEWVFKEISFKVKPGESVAFVGPSGSGKSVLFKIIAGLLEADQGTIHLETQNIGMLFQRNALFDSFTNLENLLFPLRERKGLEGPAALEKAKRLLKEVGLAGTEELYPHEISGGMQKRLGVARALIVEPELILYDEPTAGLDPVTSRKITQMLIDLRKGSKTTMLMITNEMPRAYQACDRVFVLAQGRLFSGESPEVIQKTQEPAVKQFIFGERTGPLTEKMR